MQTVLALNDIPACLDAAAAYVGPPRNAIAGRAAPLTVREPFSDADDTASFRHRVVRECFDTAAVLRVYREPLADEHWRTPAHSEQRLLAQINAIVALGPDALAQVTGLALDPDLDDPGRVFAALLVLGMTDDPAMHAQALRIFRSAVMRSAPEARAAVEALGLCPHPALNDALLQSTSDAQARLREASVRVLAFKSALPEHAWHAALHDRDPGVVTAALGAPLDGYDPGECETALHTFFDATKAEAAVRLALRAGLSIGSEAAHEFAAWFVRRDQPGWADTAYCLAMFGRFPDAPAFARLLTHADLRCATRAVARFGFVELVPELLSASFGNADDANVRNALSFITGIAFDEPPDARAAASLWERQASNFRPRERYRGGRVLSLSLMHERLRDCAGPREERETLYLEMRAATRSRVPRFRVHDFVGMQERSLVRIGAWLRHPPRTER
jgi:hypothetical protein